MSTRERASSGEAPVLGTLRPGQLFTSAVLVVSGVFLLVSGIWALAAPGSFAAWAGFPPSRHFLHDAGAFEIGVGTTLLLALAWADAIAVVLAGFLVASTVYLVSHITDPGVGGTPVQVWALGLISLLALAASGQRLRRLGYVVGEVAAASPELARFRRQKTASLTSWKRDGSPVATPLSIAVDGSRAYIRSYEKAWKVRRMRNNPAVEVAPCTALGKPTGPATPMRARRLHGGEARHAARLLARKHPLLHRVLVPCAHRVGRARFGRTVHFELTPDTRAS